jgi:hypothetical protein
LWRAAAAPHRPSVARVHRGAQVTSDQRHNPLVADPLSQQMHQAVVVDLVEEARQVDIDHPFLTFCDVPACGRHRVVRRAAGAKAPAMLAHPAVERRAQDPMQGLLDQPVLHCGNAQPARPAAGLGNVHRPHRRRLVVAP